MSVKAPDRFNPAARDAVVGRLKGAGIGCNPYFVPIHLQPYVQKLLGTQAGDSPVTEALAARTIALPFCAGLTEAQVQTVAKALESALAAVG